MGFSDTFNRADGPVGADWLIPTALPTGTANGATAITTPSAFQIVSNAAVGVLDTTGTMAAIGRWHEAVVGGGQYISASITFPGTGPVATDLPVVNFYLMLDESNFTCVGAQLLQNQLGFRLRWFHWVAGVPVGTSYDYFHEWGAAPHTLIMRFEATPAGAVRALIGDTEIADAVYDFGVPLTGTLLGMSAKFDPGTGGGGAIPRIDVLNGGALNESGISSGSSSDWRPFVVRRTTGGDVVREADLTAWQSALRYGARVVTLEEVAGTKLLTRPYFYNGAVITVQIPRTIAWEEAVLVRGGFGNPTTPQDGIVLWYTDMRPSEAGAEIDLSQEVLDTPLTPPNWYYYTLFIWIGNQWVRVADGEQLVPKDHGWGELLFNSVPPYYQKMDDEQAADGRNGPLRLFANLLGYDLNYTQCFADGVSYVYNVDRSPMKLVKLLGSNMGFPFEQVLGGNRTRSVLEQLDDLNGLRGTQLGLQRLITAASDYKCDIRMGPNDLLAVDDGDFDGRGGVPNFEPTVPDAEVMRWGIGHWEALNNSTYLDVIKDPVTPAQSAIGALAKPGIMAKNTEAGPGNVLTPPGGRGAMVVNAPGPESVVVCGRISADVFMEGVMPGVMTTGVPVTPGKLYEFSVQTIRTGWGTAPQQPPQARVILGILWFDAAGTEIKSDTGPLAPDNYDLTTWKRTSIQAFAPEYDEAVPGSISAYYATPLIWWRHAGAWAGAVTDVTTPPLFGRYISMVNFGKVLIEGEDVVPIAPDVYLTLGVDSKKLGSPSSHLGEP